jgi:hypothetical protein
VAHFIAAKRTPTIIKDGECCFFRDVLFSTHTFDNVWQVKTDQSFFTSGVTRRVVETSSPSKVT